MRPAFYTESEYKKKQSKITRKYWKDGKYNKLISPLEIRYCKNNACNSPFKIKPYEEKIYCSSRCAAIVNNSKRPRKFIICAGCKIKVNRSRGKYCSLKCQSLHQHQLYINDWKIGTDDGNRGIKTQIISGHLRYYLTEKYGNKCSLCGWNQKNPITNKVPLEIDHIDGNASNNKEENLRLICPNCHSLTPHFRNLNKGRGRAWRLKYLKQLPQTLVDIPQ